MRRIRMISMIVRQALTRFILFLDLKFFLLNRIDMIGGM